MEEMKSLVEMMEKLPSEVNIDAVFGKPEKYDDHVIIPVAEIQYGYGIGFGSADEGGMLAAAESAENDEESPESPVDGYPRKRWSSIWWGWWYRSKSTPNRLYRNWSRWHQS